MVKLFGATIPVIFKGTGRIPRFGFLAPVLDPVKVDFRTLEIICMTKGAPTATYVDPNGTETNFTIGNYRSEFKRITELSRNVEPAEIPVPKPVPAGAQVATTPTDETAGGTVTDPPKRDNCGICGVELSLVDGENGAEAGETCLNPDCSSNALKADEPKCELCDALLVEGVCMNIECDKGAPAEVQGAEVTPGTLPQEPEEIKPEESATPAEEAPAETPPAEEAKPVPPGAPSLVVPRVSKNDGDGKYPAKGKKGGKAGGDDTTA